MERYRSARRVCNLRAARDLAPMRLLLLAALVGAAASVCAQPEAGARGGSAAVNGFVRDAGTGETLIQATVLLEGTGRGDVTNAEGFYTLGGLAPGTYTLRVSFVGYTTVRREITLAPDEALRVDVELRPETLGEVVVTAEESLTEERAPGLQTVSLDLVGSLPSVFEDDLFRSIQLLPGVKAASDFSSALYIRGGSPDQTLILLDGTTVYNPTHFFGFFSTFNTEAIKDARLYKGAYPSPYGGRLGAVLDVTNREGNRNRLAGNLSVGLLASRVGLEGPFAGGRGNVMVAVRRSTLEPLLAYLGRTTDQVGIPESFYFYDVNARVGLDLTPNDRISVSGYAGRDRVGVPLGDDARFDLDYGNRTLSLAYNRVLSRVTFAQVRAAVSDYVSRPLGEVGETPFARPNAITDYSGALDVEWRPGPLFDLRAGVRGGFFDLRLRSEFNGQVGVDFRSPAGYGSAYVQTRLRPTADWVLTTGLRADHFEGLTDDRADADAALSVGYTVVSPHVQIERFLGDDVIVQASAGRYHQFVSLVSNEAFSGFDTWVTTGPGVPPQSSEQAVVGLKTRLGRAWRLDAEVYGRTMRGLFDTRPELQAIAGLTYGELFRFGEGYAYGAEILLERGVGRVTGLVAYTIGVTRRRYPDEPAFSVTFPPKYDRLHDVSAVVNAALGRRWTVTLAGVYATGQAYTLPVGRYALQDVPFVSGSYEGLFSERLNGQRLPSYVRVDAGITHTGRLLGVADYELQAQVVNVLDRRNVWFVRFDPSENPVQETVVNQLPRLPNVSLTLRF